MRQRDIDYMVIFDAIGLRTNIQLNGLGLWSSYSIVKNRSSGENLPTDCCYRLTMIDGSKL